MRFISDVKEQINQVDTTEEKNHPIEQASMELTADELKNVIGGSGIDYLLKSQENSDKHNKTTDHVADGSPSRWTNHHSGGSQYPDLLKG